ncbi:unnamed protein product, partial [marine sediment metagenome]
NSNGIDASLSTTDIMATKYDTLTCRGIGGQNLLVMKVKFRI